MRLPGWFAVFAAALAPAFTFAVDFPYQATVTTESASVRSGPGTKFYVSQALPRGAVVEVYRHDPGGWLGIRPPAGAFSWVPEDMLEPAEGNLAVVTSDHAVARVGAEDVDTRDEIQVKLNRDEVVEVLDTVTMAEGNGERRWCKIAPPAGEFRYVLRKDVEIPTSAAQTLVASPRSKAPGDVVRIVSTEEPVEAPAARVQPPREFTRKAPEPRDGWRSAQLADTGIVAPRKPTLSFSDDVDRLEHLLSTMVVQDVSGWNFRQLRADSEALLATAETATDRGRVRIIQGKFDRFEEIQHRHEAVASFKGKVDASEEKLVDARDAKDGDRVAISERFDSKGVLTAIAGRQKNDPKFALLDESGRVRCYVQPAPGVNMSSYVGREVGVNGSLGYTAEKNGQLLTAKRVELLQRVENTARAGGGTLQR